MKSVQHKRHFGIRFGSKAAPFVPSASTGLFNWRSLSTGLFNPVYSTLSSSRWGRDEVRRASQPDPVDEGGVEKFSSLDEFKRGSHRRGKYSHRHCSSSSALHRRRLRRDRVGAERFSPRCLCTCLVSGLFTGGVDCCWLVSRPTVLFDPFLTPVFRERQEVRIVWLMPPVSLGVLSRALQRGGGGGGYERR